MLPRTRGPLVSLLESRGLRLRRKHGQNFLVEPRVADAIVAEAEVAADDRVVEIGPGAGALTVPLLERAGSVVAVELDRGLAELLREELGGDPRLRLVHGDALAAPLPADGRGDLHPSILEALDRPRTPSGRVLVVANLPYSVGTEVVVRLLRAAHPPDAIVVMLQAEVVARLAAAPGTEAYGPLAVLIALTARVRTLRRVGREAFFPRPEVESVVVRIEPDAARCASPEVRAAADLARTAFLHRRKMLARALDGSATRADLGSAGLDPSARPETVPPDGWLRLARTVARQDAERPDGS